MRDDKTVAVALITAGGLVIAAIIAGLFQPTTMTYLTDLFNQNPSPPRSPDTPTPHGTVRNCSLIDNGMGFICYAKDGPGNTVTTNIANSTNSIITASYSEWHYGCITGRDVNGQRNAQTLSIPPQLITNVAMNSPGSGVTCRESWVTNCVSNNKAVRCSDYLKVTWTTTE